MNERPILKRKLAAMYYPDLSPRSACNSLHDELQRTPALLRALLRAGYDPQSRDWYFTPRQHALILRHLGLPAGRE